MLPISLFQSSFLDLYIIANLFLSTKNLVNYQVLFFQLDYPSIHTFIYLCFIYTLVSPICISHLQALNIILSCSLIAVYPNFLIPIHFSPSFLSGLKQ